MIDGSSFPRKMCQSVPLSVCKSPCRFPSSPAFDSTLRLYFRLRTHVVMLAVASICFSVTASEVKRHSAHVWPQSDLVTGMHFKICPFITYRAVHFFSTWRNASYFWKVYFIFDTLVSKLCGLPSLASQWQFDEQNFSVLTLSSLLLCDLLTRYFCSPFKKSLSPSKLWRSRLLLLSGRPIIFSFTQIYDLPGGDSGVNVTQDVIKLISYMMRQLTKHYLFR